MLKTKKRSKLTFWLVAALCLNLLQPGLVQPPAEAAPMDTFFYDVSQGDDLYPYLRFMHEKGYATGFPDGSFRPDFTLTRAQTAALLVRTSESQRVGAPATSFRDVGEDHWAKASIDAAVAAGLMKGYPGGLFRPDQLVTRAEAAALALRLTKATAPVPDFSNDIWDVPANSWAKNSIYIAVDAGVFYLKSRGHFAPDAPATRGEMIRALATMLCLAPETRNVELVGTVKRVAGSVTYESSKDSGHLRTGDKIIAGMTITTGKDSELEVVYPDGSGFKMLASSILVVKKSQGRQSILASGKAEPAIDFLNLDLEVGKTFIALSPAPTLEEDDLAAASPAIASLDEGWHLLADNAKNIWYKTARKKKVKVQVDMPWGVAGARGSYLLVQVDHHPGGNFQDQGDGRISVLEGNGFASGGGSTSDIPPGMESQLSGQGQSPSPPQPMPPSTQYQWSQNAGWVAAQAELMQENAPVLGNPMPPAQQEGTSPPPPAPVTQLILENLVRFTPDAEQGAPPPPAPPEPPPSGGGGHSSAKEIRETEFGILLSDGSMTAVPDNTTASAFKAGLKVTGNARIRILSSLGDEVNYDEPIEADMKVELTAQNGSRADYLITVLKIGDAYAGGVVTYIESVGGARYNQKIQTGIIAATSDQSPGIMWSNITSTAVGVSSGAINAGRNNTALIVGSAGCTTGAALLCSELVLNGYDDWHLPSSDELATLHGVTSAAVTPGPGSYYWASTEHSGEPGRQAEKILLIAGRTINHHAKSQPYLVRAVRYF